MTRKDLLNVMAVIIILLLPGLLVAQKTVTGRVLDATTNQPLVAATVTQIGTKNSTATEANGSFSLNVTGNSPQLIVTFVGYEPQRAEARDGIIISLTPSNSRLNEVIVSGLATTIKRANSANAVSSISSKELLGTTQHSTLDGALMGKFPGADISQNSGAPGGGITVKMRGITSIVGNSQPLFIVDGIIYDNSAVANGTMTVTAATAHTEENVSNRLADLDPNDIERVEILKGASAAAIYGAKAAGGVVIITTKRGHAGKAKIELSQSFGANVQLRKLGMRQWDDQKILDAFGQSMVDYFHANGSKQYDYEKELFGRKGLLSDSRISVSGGSDKTTYYIGATRDENQGIVKNTGYVKNSYRVTISQKVNNRLDFTATLNYVNSTSNRALFNNDNTGVSMGVSFAATPGFIDLHPDANGVYPDNPMVASNFLQTRDLMTNRENLNRVTTGGTINWTIQKSDKNNLKAIGNGGIDFYNLLTTSIFPPTLQFEKGGLGTNGASILGNTVTRNDNMSIFLVDEFRPNLNLSFRTQVGATQEKVNMNSVWNTATQLIGTQTNLDQSGAIQAEQTRTLQLDKGFFIQEEINIKDMLILTGGVRGDKSSRNGLPNKLYYYPKASVAFNILQIPSLNSKLFNSLKVRAAFGESGNFAPFGAIFTAMAPTIFNGATGSLVSSPMGNANLKPERQKEFETGIDFSMLDSRLSASFTYYQKGVEDLILSVTVPYSSGFSTSWGNFASIRNRGVEISVTGQPIKTDKIVWNSVVNFWMNRAIVTRLDVPAFNLGAFGASLGTYRIQQGLSPTIIVGNKGPKDTKIDPTSGLAILGDGQPKFQMSFSEDVQFKNWELSALIHWKHGGDNINLTPLLQGPNMPDYDKTTMDPEHKVVNGEYMGVVGLPRFDVQDAGFVRIREIGIFYHMPKDWFKGVADVKVGFSGRNLFNWFKYNSYDPEVSDFGTGAISSNVEVTPFPSSKSYSFNLTVTF